MRVPLVEQPRVALGARYTAEPVPRTYPGSQGWGCQCNVKPYRRHREPWQCLRQEAVDLWRAHYPAATCSPTVGRVLSYLAKEFGR